MSGDIFPTNVSLVGCFPHECTFVGCKKHPTNETFVGKISPLMSNLRHLLGKHPTNETFVGKISPLMYII